MVRWQGFLVGEHELVVHWYTVRAVSGGGVEYCRYGEGAENAGDGERGKSLKRILSPSDLLC